MRYEWPAFVYLNADSDEDAQATVRRFLDRANEGEVQVELDGPALTEEEEDDG